MHPLVIFGLLFNSALICINRFWKDLGWLYTVGLLIGIAAIIAGAILSRAS